METREGAAVGHLTERQQAVRRQSGGTGGCAVVKMGVQRRVVAHVRIQQKRAMRVRGHGTERLLGASRRFTRVRQVTTAVGS